MLEIESNDGTILTKSTNTDLIWEFRESDKRNIAREFIAHFANKLCVYSGAVGQLYSNYEIFFPREENGRLVILPDQFSYHDTFQGLPEAAVKPTGFYIVPKIKSSKKEMLIRLPIKTRDQNFRDVPIQIGLHFINRQLKSPILPVVVKGDLRELDHNMPALHLHCIDINQLTLLSKFETDNISKIIIGRLEDIK